MQFWGKFGEIICWLPPGSWRPLLREILDPPLPLEVGGPEVNKFEQVSSDGHQMSLPGGQGWGPMYNVKGAGARARA